MMPGRLDWLFSARTFAAAALALWIGMAAGLDRPYWAFASAYIVSQPYSAGTRSRAVFRLVGTALGAVAAVAMVPPLVNAPALLTAAAALWTGVCLMLGLLDRSPRGYAWSISAVTAPVIVFSSVAVPDSVWDIAVSRTEEIGLGIVCATMMASVVLPRNAGPVLSRRLARWFEEAMSCAAGLLDVNTASGASRDVQLRLLAEAAEIDAFTDQLAWDPSKQGRGARSYAALRARMFLLLPILSALEGAQGAAWLPPSAARVMDRVSTLLRTDGEAGEELRSELDTLGRTLSSQAGWQALLLTSLGLRLSELLAIRADSQVLQRAIARGGRLPAGLRFAPGLPSSNARHRDWSLAVSSAGAAVVATTLGCAFWIASGWPEGAACAQWAAIGCALFATVDDPAPQIMKFLRWTAAAVLFDAVLLFAVLPMVHDFAGLIVVLSPPFLLFGLLMAKPSTAVGGLAVAVSGATLMGLAGSYNAEFAPFANSAAATVMGLTLAVVVTRIFRSVDAEWTASRLLRSVWRSLASGAAPSGPGDRVASVALMVDRFGMIGMRLAGTTPDEAQKVGDPLLTLRIGLNSLDLRRARRTLSGDAGSAVDDVLLGLHRYYGALQRPWAAQAPKDLLRRLDHALSVVRVDGAEAGRLQALLGLGGLRRALFAGADAPAWLDAAQQQSSAAPIRTTP